MKRTAIKGSDGIAIMPADMTAARKYHELLPWVKEYLDYSEPE